MVSINKKQAADHFVAPPAFRVGDTNVVFTVSPLGEALKSPENMVSPPGEALKSSENTVPPPGEALKSSENTVPPLGEALKSSENMVSPLGEALKSPENMVSPLGEALKSPENTVPQGRCTQRPYVFANILCCFFLYHFTNSPAKSGGRRLYEQI
jgi:hypothetical protein